jgi:hypothetical protein
MCAEGDASLGSKLTHQASRPTRVHKGVALLHRYNTNFNYQEQFHYYVAYSTRGCRNDAAAEEHRSPWPGSQDPSGCVPSQPCGCALQGGEQGRDNHTQLEGLTLLLRCGQGCKAGGHQAGGPNAHPKAAVPCSCDGALRGWERNMTLLDNKGSKG